MRRPVLVATATTIALLLVASPALRTRWSGIDASVLPTSQSARIVSDTLARDFPAQDLNSIMVAARAPASAAPQLDAYAASLRAVAGVVGVGQPVYLGAGVWKLTVAAAGDPISAAAQRTVEGVRATPAPVRVVAGGQAADFHDQRSAIADSLPLALVALVALTLTILWVIIVRAALVPSLMVLLGWRNWWSPKPLRHLHRRLAISETRARSAEPSSA